MTGPDKRKLKTGDILVDQQWGDKYKLEILKGRMCKWLMFLGDPNHPHCKTTIALKKMSLYGMRVVSKLEQVLD